MASAFSTGVCPIVVVGSCNADLITSSHNLPKAGETLIGSAYEEGFGGKGANQAVQAAKLGSGVAMVGMLGRDSLGERTLSNFDQYGIERRHVLQTSEAASGVATILVAESGENSIIIVPGANLYLTGEHVKDAFPVIQSASVVLTQNEISPETTLAALKSASGSFSVWNAAPALQPNHPLFENLLKACSLVCVNETEAATMAGCSVGNKSEAKNAAQTLIDLGAKAVLVTLGGDGSLYLAADGKFFDVPPSPPVRVFDTTGAGDSFLGAFAHAVADGNDVLESMHFASKVASISVGKRGTQCSYPSQSELS